MQFRKTENTYTNCYNANGYDIVEIICGEETHDLYVYDDAFCVAKFTIVCCRGVYAIQKVNWIDENEDEADMCDFVHDIIWHWNNKYDEMLKLIS